MHGPGGVRHDACGETEGWGDVSELRVRFATDPASVPGARRFVSDGLASWGLSHLVDDIALCVTELAANAALHSAGSFMFVGLSARAKAVRVSVEDDGAVPGALVMPRTDFAEGDGPVAQDVEDEPTTGRGLAIVDVLASAWGVEDVSGGKRVWADFSTDGSSLTREGRQAGPEAPSGALPGGWTVVRLAACPVRLSLRQDDHLDELVRELQLLNADDAPRSKEIASEIQGLLAAPAHARYTGRRIATLAQEAGLEHVDVDMALPIEASQMIRGLQSAVTAADQLCLDRRLLTLASSEDLVALRQWMTEEIVAQIEEGRAPVPWPEWRRAG
jgi:anti-sigma regulatory factor (Ser/Thr protein kinase)